MDILVNVVNQKLKITTNLKNFVSGTQEFIRFNFNLSDEWSNLKTFAQFGQNGNAFNVYLDENNNVYLPPEIIEGTCTLMLYGIGGKTIGTTNYLTLKIDGNILIKDANSTEITESLYNQLVSKIELYISKFDELVTEERLDSLVTGKVNEYIEDGTIAGMTIPENSITRNKLAEDVENVLIKAENIDTTIPDNSIEPSKFSPDIKEILVKAETAAQIPIVTKLPEEAKNGDMCLLTKPNSFEPSDSGGRLYFDWEGLLGVSMDYIMGISTEEIFDENILPSESISYFIEGYNNINGDAIYMNIDAYAQNDIYAIYYTISCSYGNEFREYSLNFENGKFVSENEDGDLISYLCKIKFDENGNTISEEYYPITLLPSYVELSFLEECNCLEIEDSQYNWFYSPYRLMVYRDGWYRLNNNQVYR